MGGFLRGSRDLEYFELWDICLIFFSSAKMYAIAGLCGRAASMFFFEDELIPLKQYTAGACGGSLWVFF